MPENELKDFSNQENKENKDNKENKEDKENMGMDLRFTNAQKLDIKKALKRGIYQELYDRDYLSDAQLNELLGRNT